MILSKLKLWALAALSILSTVLFGLWKNLQAKRAKEKLKGVEKARETERKAVDALVTGLEKEQDADIDPNKRNHFE